VPPGVPPGSAEHLDIRVLHGQARFKSPRGPRTQIDNKFSFIVKMSPIIERFESSTPVETEERGPVGRYGVSVTETHAEGKHRLHITFFSRPGDESDRGFFFLHASASQQEAVAEDELRDAGFTRGVSAVDGIDGGAREGCRLLVIRLHPFSPVIQARRDRAQGARTLARGALRNGHFVPANNFRHIRTHPLPEPVSIGDAHLAVHVACLCALEKVRGSLHEVPRHADAAFVATSEYAHRVGGAPHFPNGTVSRGVEGTKKLSLNANKVSWVRQRVERCVTRTASHTRAGACTRAGWEA
jgi:hypothetical protein